MEVLIKTEQQKQETEHILNNNINNYNDLENIRIIKVLGKGAMGTVFLAYDITTDPKAQTPFALKVVEKPTRPDADRRARWEIKVLSKLHDHPFLPTLLASFDTPDFLAWSIPFCPGGDLNVLRHRQSDHVFSPSVLRFYLAEIVCALEHLHRLGIVYRDLKPENILVQLSGHVTLTDFDLSRFLHRRSNNAVVRTLPSSSSFSTSSSNNNINDKLKRHSRNISRWVPVFGGDQCDGCNGGGATKKGLRLKKAKSARVSPVSRRRTSFSGGGGGERSNSFVGTDEYISPEVVRGEGHEFAVDWWALGILCYEMLYGKTPFKGKNRKETFHNILIKEVEFVGKRSELTDLIQRLLEKDPTKRLGYFRGAVEIKEHAIFNGVSWDLLMQILRPPIIPSDDLTENLTSTVGMGVKDYFHNLHAPPLPSFPPSPLMTPSRSSQQHQTNVLLTEF